MGKGSDWVGHKPGIGVDLYMITRKFTPFFHLPWTVKTIALTYKMTIYGGTMKRTKKFFYVAPFVGSFLLFAPSAANAACLEADNYAFQIRSLESQKASLNSQLCYASSCSSLARFNLTRQIDSIRTQISTLNSLKQSAIRNCMNPVKKK